MMREDLLQKVSTREALAILTDDSGNIVWETDKSPVAGMYHAYYEGGLSGTGNLVLYADQAGIAMGIMAGKIPIRECHAVRISEGGLRIMNEKGVAVTYEEAIPLVKSSKDNSKVCPIEQFLFEHGDSKEEWEFLEERYK